MRRSIARTNKLQSLDFPVAGGDISWQDTVAARKIVQRLVISIETKALLNVPLQNLVCYDCHTC